MDLALLLGLENLCYTQGQQVVFCVVFRDSLSFVFYTYDVSNKFL